MKSSQFARICPLPCLSVVGRSSLMLKDSLLNFATPAKGHSAGLDHFGFQVDTLQELEELRQHTETGIGSGNVLDPQNTSCCYAKSEKYWSIYPTGLAWEHFYTHSDTPEFGCDNNTQEDSCCIPLHNSGDSQSSPCCIPNNPLDNNGACCG